MQTLFPDIEEIFTEDCTTSVFPDDPIPFPDKQYACVVIDPPWPIKKIQRKVRPNQVEMDYPVMSVDEIKELDIPSLLMADAWVFLWTTQKYFPVSFNILDVWGLKYR